MSKLKLDYIPLGLLGRISIPVGFLFMLISLWLGLNFFIYKRTVVGIIISLIFLGTVTPLIIILLNRNTILKKYPYLISLPSFVYGLNPKKASKVLSAIFDMYATLILFSGIYSIAIILELYYVNITLTTILDSFLIFLSVLLVFIQYSRAYRLSK